MDEGRPHYSYLYNIAAVVGVDPKHFPRIGDGVDVVKTVQDGMRDLIKVPVAGSVHWDDGAAVDDLENATRINDDEIVTARVERNVGRPSILYMVFGRMLESDSVSDGILYNKR